MVVSLASALWFPYLGVQTLPAWHQQVAGDHLNLPGKITDTQRHKTPAYCQRRQWHPTPVLLPGKSHGWRSLVGCSPWDRKESDTTEQLHFLFSLSCIGEGNDNLLQCSCLENPRDGEAWWAAAYGVAQNRTRLKRLSSSSSKGFHDLVLVSA